MPFLILSILIQVVFVIHVLKTGRNTIWIWIVVMLPLAGSIAYFILEVLPELTSSRSGRQAGRKIRKIVNPNMEINTAAKNYSAADSVENSMKLAEECIKKELYFEAKELYSKCLSGPHKEDPYLMFGLARSEFHLAEYQKSKDILDDLIRLNPDYKSQEAHLLYARSLDALDHVSEALHEYEVLYDYFTGPDAAYYLAKFLKNNNQIEKANDLFNQIIEQAKNSSKHYNVLHSEVIKSSKVEVSS